MNVKHKEMCGKVQHAEVSAVATVCHHAHVCDHHGGKKMWPRLIKSDQAKAEHVTGWNRFDFQARLSMFFKA